MDATWPTTPEIGSEDDANSEEGANKNEGSGQAEHEKSSTADHTSNDDDKEEYGNMAVDNFNVSSDANSDFDSDEVLSGDEAIIHMN
jgi:hypothetical protein